MAIGNDKVRVLITIPKDMKDQLEIQAKKENRNVSNLINTVLIKYLSEIDQV